MTELAFVSYARVDWEADQPVLQHMLSQIAAQARAAHGSRWLELWRDEDNLRWGDLWESKLHEAIGASDLLIVLLSPGWLRSDYCRQELAAFLQREKRLGGQRIFVAQIRDVTEDAPDVTAGMRVALKALHTRQIRDWGALFDADQATRDRSYRAAGTDLAAWLRAHTPALPAAETMRPMPLPVTDRQPVSGSLDVSPCDDGPASVLVDLAFAGLCEVKTRRGRFVFGLQTAHLHVTADGGQFDDLPDFDPGGCAVDVVPSVSHKQERCFDIRARKQPLYGKVLRAPGKSGYVPLLRLDRRDGANRVVIEGHVSVKPRCLAIDRAQSQPKGKISADPDKLEAMYRAFAEIILDEHGARFALEGSEA